MLIERWKNVEGHGRAWKGMERHGIILSPARECHAVLIERRPHPISSTNGLKAEKLQERPVRRTILRRGIGTRERSDRATLSKAASCIGTGKESRLRASGPRSRVGSLKRLLADASRLHGVDRVGDSEVVNLPRVRGVKLHVRAEDRRREADQVVERALAARAGDGDDC